MTGAALALSALLAAAAAAEGTYVERVGDAQVDWSSRTVAAEARSPRPVGSSATPDSWRAAESGARREAQQKALAALQSLRVFGRTTVADLVRRRPELVAALAKLVEGFRAVETRYEDGGAVGVVVAGSLDGRLVQALVPEAGRAAAPPQGSEDAATSVVVSARGIAAGVAVAPRLYDETGALLFDATMLDAEGLGRFGGAAYFRSLERASRVERAGGRPLIVKAVRATDPLGADLVIAASDATRVKRAVAAMAEGRLLVVVD